MSKPAITVDHVTKRFRVPIDYGRTLQYRFSHPVSTSRYRDLIAVNDVSFEVADGEFLGITGPNGCGKSTLLKMISRIYDPDTGRVATRGRISPFIELGVGFKQELSARENIYLAGAVLGLTRAQLATRVDEVFNFAELVEFADQKLKNYSSGMSSRLAFSVAMLADADILLLDEVLAVGDARFREKCLSVFDHYRQEKRTVVLVSHDLSTLELYCDRLLLMLGGRLVADGAPNEVAGQYRRITSARSEADRRPAGEALGTPNSRRYGAREVEVTAVRLLDHNGRPHHSFLTGEVLTVEVDYISNTLRERFNCSLGFGANNGRIFLAGSGTRSAELPLSPEVQPGSRGTFAFQIPSLNLLSGSYLVTVVLEDERLNHVYDRIDYVAELRVTDERGRLGMVDLSGKWTHREDTALLDDSGAVA